MSNYTITVPWSGKDALSDSDPAKVISGADFNTEFTAVQTAVNTKAELNGSATESFSATKAPVNTDTTQVATTSFVKTAVSGTLGSLGVNSTVAELNKLDGFTGTKDDLNYAKDLRATGVTSTEFNKLDGFTGTATDLNYAKDLRAKGVTVTELDYCDGVTSSIQTQLNGRATDGELSSHAGLRSSSTVFGHAKIYVSGTTLYIKTS